MGIGLCILCGLFLHLAPTPHPEGPLLLAGGNSQQYSDALLARLAVELDITGWTPLGLGSCSTAHARGTATAHYAVLAWPSAHQLRCRLGLTARQHFHVSLGFNPADVHGQPKGLSTLVAPSQLPFPKGNAASMAALMPPHASGCDNGTATQLTRCAGILLQQALVEVEATPATSTAGSAGSTNTTNPMAWEHYRALVTAASEAITQAMLAGPASSAVTTAVTTVAAAAAILQARLAGRDGDLAACMAHCRQAVALDPHQPLACLLLAKALFQQGLHAAALQAFEAVGPALEQQALRVSSALDVAMAGQVRKGGERRRCLSAQECIAGSTTRHAWMCTSGA